jgi:hypothetical protein
MTETPRLKAKVVLLDGDAQQCQAIAEFCRDVGLEAFVLRAQDVLAALDQHKDLAGVLLSEDLAFSGEGELQLALQIHKQRPELPLFLRRTSPRALDASEHAVVRHQWTAPDMAALQASVERSIFSLLYPSSLVEGIVDLSAASLRSMFPNATLEVEPPYVVHDRIIHGEVSTLIALESTWCRGYMMLQTEENALRQGVVQGLGFGAAEGDLDFRELNNLLGETTNLIWGAFKNRYIPPQAFANQQTQVPIVINHARQYISFGSPDPQLCIRYHLKDAQRPQAPALTIVQRFIFNLHWSPEQFTEYSARASDADHTGELDLF